MPPKSAKKTPPGPGTKRGSRAKSVIKVDDENKKKKKKEQISTTQPQPLIDSQPPLTDTDLDLLESKDDAKDGEIVKESVNEYERDEWLDLEDNEPDYEPEEFGGVDYEKETEQEEVQEEGDDMEEVEGDNDDVAGEEDEEDDDDVPGEEDEEDDDDVTGDKIEGAVNEGEEDEENVGEEKHREMVDVEEEQDHHDVFQERRKRKEFEVFVGGLDKDATDDDLRKVFCQVGEVTEVRLMMNPQTNKNKGFAFLRFATVEQAKRACEELKSPLVNGKKCGVTPSQDNDTLFLGNICKTWTKEALKDKLNHYGVENVEDVTLAEDGNNKGSNRGFAFLEFSSRSEAMGAFKILQKRDINFGVDKPAKVSFADAFIDPSDEIMAQVKTVFIDNLPASWDEDHVKELLKKFGHVEKIELARNMPSAKRKDFGFVTFDTHEAAVTCAKGVNNQELGEGEVKAKVRARLSRPLQRGRGGKHVVSREYRPARGVAIRSVRPPLSRRPGPFLPLRGGVRDRRSRMNMPPVVNRGFKRPVAFRDRRPVMSVPLRSRPLPPPPRSYQRRPPATMYPKGGHVKRDYGRRDEPPPRGGIVAPPEYTSRLMPERRRPSYREEEYSSRGYSDLPRPTSRTSARRTPYVDDGYGPRYERPLPSYREGRSGHEYDAVSGSKRSYSSIDDVPPRYADAGVRHSRARSDYDLGGSGDSHYGDGYSDRLGRSSLEYGSGRTSLSSLDPHGLYGSSRHGTSYSRNSLSGSDVGGMYSSRYSGDYVSRESDVGSGSYSSLYPSRGLGGSSFAGSGSSGSYY